MRPHGRARISASKPEALAICQRCGFMYNKSDLQWQWDWQFGPRLRNLGIQVCADCLDVPQESGRTIVLPPDPVPVSFPLPEDYAAADNPLSYLGFNVANIFSGGTLTPAADFNYVTENLAANYVVEGVTGALYVQEDASFTPTMTSGGNIGNMTLNAGIDAAFNSVTNKRAPFCAALSVSNSSFNTVGKNWWADPSGTSITLPSTFGPTTHIMSSYTLYAPSDQAFLNSATGITPYYVQGSSNGSTWTTLSSGTTGGTVGEIISGSVSSTNAYQYHQVAIVGDGFSAVAIAQAILNFSDAEPNDI